MAMGLGRPNDSRARPSSLLKREDDYGRIFDPDLPLEIYLWCVKTQRSIDSFLSTIVPSSNDRTNYRFHLATLLVARALGQQVHQNVDLAPLASESRVHSTSELQSALADLSGRFLAFSAETVSTPDRVAKSRDFVDRMMKAEFPELLD
jgi:hypothetical protein